MKKNFFYLAVVVAFLGLFTACRKDKPDTSNNSPSNNQDTLGRPNPLSPPISGTPVARAGNDTTLYMPFSAYNLNGVASLGIGSNLVSFDWRQVAGPVRASIDQYNKVKAYAYGMVNVGIYEFELTVTNANNLSSKDTIKITVAEPRCTQQNKEVIINNLSWDYSWIMEIAIYKPFSYLPPNSHLTNIYIKRDGTNSWERVVPVNWNAPDYGVLPEWEYGNNFLVIYPGKNKADDTPDIKLEYCL